MKLTIDRSRWHRNKGGPGSALVRRLDGKMCCLGFLGCALGGDPASKDGDKGMLGREYPAEHQKFWPRWLFAERPDRTLPGRANHVVTQLAWINDDSGNEAKITEILAEYGVEVEFVDGEAAAP